MLPLDTTLFGILTFKVNRKDARTRYKISSRIILKAPEKHEETRFDVFVNNLEYKIYYNLL